MNTKKGQPKLAERIAEEQMVYSWSRMYKLGLYSFMCIVKIEIGDTSFFPPTDEEVDYAPTWIVKHGGKVDGETTKANRFQKERVDEIRAFLSDNPLERIRHIDIKNRDSLQSIMEICFYLSDAVLWTLQYPDIFPIKNLENILSYCRVAAEKVYELSGYWTAKMEISKQNTNSANTMKKKGLENDNAIGELISQYKITSLQSFRREKILRESFIKEAKKATTDPKCNVSLAEGTILRKANKILKGKPPT
jgi:hypothetical protein